MARLGAIIICIFLASSTLGNEQAVKAISAHFDGQIFHNVPETKDKTLIDLLKWLFAKRTLVLEKNSVVVNQKTKPTSKNETNNIVLTFVGHSTFLLQAHGMSILTDPIWSSRCSPVSFIGPKRLHDPGIDFDDLPKIDVVIISHNHYDHMDLPTLLRLWQRDHPLFIVPLKNRSTLQSEGIGNIVEQDWWQAISLRNGITITSVPAQHWSGRYILDRNRALWSGFVISFGDKNVFFAGDTGFGPHFSSVKERFKNFEIALLPIGAYLPRWFMRDYHMSPSDALLAAKILGAKKNIPMHFGTFALGDDGFSQAKKELTALMNQEPDVKFFALAVGEAWQSDQVLGSPLNPAAPCIEGRAGYED